MCWSKNIPDFFFVFLKPSFLFQEKFSFVAHLFQRPKAIGQVIPVQAAPCPLCSDTLILPLVSTTLSSRFWLSSLFLSMSWALSRRLVAQDENKQPSPRAQNTLYSASPLNSRASLATRHCQKVEGVWPPLLATILPWKVLPLAESDLHRLDKILQVAMNFAIQCGASSPEEEASSEDSACSDSDTKLTRRSPCATTLSFL